MLIQKSQTMWHFIDVLLHCINHLDISWIHTFKCSSNALLFTIFVKPYTYMETVFLATIVLNTIWPCPHLTSTSSTCRFCREHTEIISKGWRTSDHMTAHMIQPPDQVDDIIQGEYNMSQVPTGLLWLLEKNSHILNSDCSLISRLLWNTNMCLWREPGIFSRVTKQDQGF